MSAAEAFKIRFEELINFIDRIIDKLESGAPANLGDLDRQVAALCKEVQESGKETAEAVKPLMAEMIGKLDQLAISLENHQGDSGGKRK